MISRTALLASVFLGLMAAPLAAQPQATATAPSVETAYDRLFQQANQSRLRGRPDLAIEALRKILDSQPGNADALFQIGEMQIQMQDLDAARVTIAQLKKVSPADPRIGELEHTLAFGPPNETLLTEARRLVEAKQYDQAIATYRQAFNGARPPQALAVEFYETLAGTQGGAEEARRQLKLLADRPNADIRIRLAYARTLTYSPETRREGIVLLGALTGDPTAGQQAHRAQREALLWLTATPDDKPLYDAYLQRFANDDAVKQKLADSLKPRLDPASQRIADAYQILDTSASPDEAARRIEALLKTDSANPDLVAALGIAQLRGEHFAEARDLLSRASAMAPTRQAEWSKALATASFWAAYGDAGTLRDRKEIAKAEQIARTLVDKASRGEAGEKELTASQNLLADLLRRQNRGREAEALYREVLKRDAGDKEAQSGLLEILLAQGRDPASEPLLAGVATDAKDRLRSKRAHDAGEQLRAGAKAAEKTDVARSEALYRQGMQADPSNVWIAYDLASLLNRNGRGSEGQALMDSAAASSTEGKHAAAVYAMDRHRLQDALGLLNSIPANQRNARVNALIAQIHADENLDRQVAAARAGDQGARAAILATASAPSPTPQQAANTALALARIGETAQAMAIVRRLSPRTDLPTDVTRTLFYASLEAGADADATALSARLGAAGADTVALRETIAIRHADRLREQKQLSAAFDTLAPLASRGSPSIPLRLALARVYRDSRFTSEAMQVLEGIAASPSPSAETLGEAASIAIDIGKSDRALAWLASAQKLQPDNARLYLLQARALREAGDNDGARRALETARQLNAVGRQSSLPVGPASSTGRRPPPRSQIASLGGWIDGIQAQPERDRSFTIQLAQAGGTPILPSAAVPLRRPGAAPSGPSTASVPGTAPATADQDNPLGREIAQEMASLDKKSTLTIQGDIGYRFRSGDPGLGALNEISGPMKARIPVGKGAISATAAPIALNAGTMATDQTTLDKFGSNAAAPAGTGLTPTTTNTAGVGLGLGFDWGMFAADIGTSPLGFAITNVLGGVSFQAALNDSLSVRLAGSRRSITDSVLSFAGMTDPRTGTTWGGVTRSGGEGVLSFDNGTAGAYAKVAYGAYTGNNVQSNNGLEVSTGAYFRAIKDESRELRVGLAATYLSFNQNLSGFTLGQGGYFSPQSFYTVGVPVDWTEQSGRLKYNVGGTIGVQSIQTSASALFPLNADLQSAAVNNANADSTRSAYNQASSITKVAFAARLGIEYAVTDTVTFGGRAEIDNSQNYTEGKVSLFLRSTFN